MSKSNRCLVVFLNLLLIGSISWFLMDAPSLFADSGEDSGRVSFDVGLSPPPPSGTAQEGEGKSVEGRVKIKFKGCRKKNRRGRR